MKMIILFILIAFNISNWNSYGKEENIFLKTEQELPLNVSSVIESRKDFTLQGKNYLYEYKVDNNVIRIATKKYTDGFQNEIYSEGVLIGKLQKNSWSSIPYYYKNQNVGVLFFEEGDEQGAWGYSIFLVKGNIIKEIGFMNIASVNNTSLNKFLSLTQNGNIIIFNFLEPQIFSDERIMDKSEKKIQIDLNTLKIIDIIKEDNSIINFSFDNNKYIADFTAKSVSPKSSKVYFNNNFLILQRTFTDNNPHTNLEYKFYIKYIQNKINVNKIEFLKETYVEYDDLCKISYTYLPKRNFLFPLDQIESFTENDLESFSRQLTISEALELVSLTNKYNHCTSKLSQDEIDLLLENFPITPKTINDYNNIAFYTHENKSYHESLFLLEKILEKDPNRVVAWLNIADTQWMLNNSHDAKNSYQKYITLMKIQKKDLNRIPKRVYDRTK
ncbi:hypothetical protein [uncultured Chryseobacterium sp.]|uniref:tetratricopeptide repeat protein n=1 Tax=uncultured Chryseobacterium sp. TaxID=259322 RepID=UPI0025D5B9D6|nr:hypothetical protein [uncultured Chryseobacterium sp.]